MTQEEKQILLKDLCARLPYGVKVLVQIHKDDATSEVILPLNGFNGESSYKLWIHNEKELAKYGCCGRGFYVNEVKPYLRPMSSMTKEERKELGTTMSIIAKSESGDIHLICATTDGFDWLNKNMFDYRGLIPKGLALEALEGMYSK